MTDSSLPASPGRLRWLRSQVDLWVREGIIPATSGERIAAAYGTPEGAEARRARALFIALCGLALLLFSAGVFLLIGFNWEALPRAVRVGIIFTTVTVAFATSSISYARGRPTAGDLLAFVGTLFYGSAIWLLAQVFHIESHWPDGMMWWGLGALLVAYLLASQLTGLQAVALLTLWTTMEVGWFSRQHYFFLPALAVLIALAWRLASPSLMVTSLLSGTLWLAVMTGSAWHAPQCAFPMMALAGCALYAAGAGITGTRWPGQAVRTCGIVVILFALTPLTFTRIHDAWWGASRIVTWGVTLSAALLILFVATVFLKRVPGEWRRSFAIPVVTLVSALPIVSLAGAGHGENYRFLMAVLFSAASLTMGVWLILRGVRLDRGWSFFGGVIYILLFVVVRWIDLIGDMLTSSAVFFAASIILATTAFYWRRRTAPVSGGPDA